MTYLGSCSGNCKNRNVNQIDFFKIDEDGVHDDGTWVSEDLADVGTYTVTVPPNIKAGNYMLRHEFVNLEKANALMGAQFFPMCGAITVTGGGNSVPSNTVRFPSSGLNSYNILSPGIFININNVLNPGSYVIPGPSCKNLPTLHDLKKFADKIR